MSIENEKIILAEGEALLSHKPKDLVDHILIGYIKRVVKEIESNTDIPPSQRKRYLRELARVNNKFCARLERRERDASHMVINLEDYK